MLLGERKGSDYLSSLQTGARSKSFASFGLVGYHVCQHRRQPRSTAGNSCSCVGSISGCFRRSPDPATAAPPPHATKSRERNLLPCHSNTMRGGIPIVLLLIIAIIRVAHRVQALAPKTTPVTLHSGLCVEDNFSLRSILDRASVDAQRFGMADSLPMGYSIFDGTSALRSFLADDDDENDLDVFRPSSFGMYGLRNPPAFYRTAAALLLSRGNLEAAHEVILGVTPHNLDEAEFAATHRGQTDWAERHPLTDSTLPVPQFISEPAPPFHRRRFRRKLQQASHLFS